MAFLRPPLSDDSVGSASAVGDADTESAAQHLVPGMQVAVKMLRSDVSEQAKKDFYYEMRMLARLNNPHIVRVLGVVTKSEPLCVLVEYMKYGDLHQFLQNKFPPADICNNFTPIGSAAATLPIPGRGQASGLRYISFVKICSFERN